MKIGIYTRESRDDNEDSYETIETQRDLLLDYVRSRQLGEVFRIYMDDNVSGSAFDRKGLSELKEDAAAGRIQLVLLKDLSRLGRNNAKTLLFLDFLEEYGVRVVTFDGKYDSIRDNDTVGIETWFNERYVRDISRKIRANLRFKIQKGEYLGHAPYGYKKSDTQKNRLCIDEASAPVVRDIFSLYLEGYGCKAIAEILNTRECAPPSGKGRWNAAAVHRITGSRVYLGDTVQGVSEKISFKSKKTRRLPNERWVVTQNTHEPIISEEEYRVAQELKKARLQKASPHKGKLHLLKGLLFCGHCGNGLIARERKGRPLGYICGRYSRYGSKACRSHHIREDEIAAVLEQELLELLSNSRLVQKVLESMAEEHNREKSEARYEKLKLQLKDKLSQQDSLYMDKLEGKITEDLFLRTNKIIEARIAQLKSLLEKAMPEKKEKIAAQELIPQLLDFVRNCGIWREAAVLMVESVTVVEAGDKIQENMENNAVQFVFRYDKTSIYENTITGG